MSDSTDSSQEKTTGQRGPTPETRAKFAGDATGDIGGHITHPVEPDTLPHKPEPPTAHLHNPGKPATTTHDPGWSKEGQGSALAQEREGVPEGDIPENISESAAQPRPKA